MTLITQFFMDIYTYIINIIFPKEITDNATVDNQCNIANDLIRLTRAQGLK